MVCISWSGNEIQTLTEYYPKASHSQLIKLLPNRSFKAIQSKAYKLKLKRVCREPSHPYYRKNEIKLYLSSVEWSYIAGILDGEGTITIKHRVRTQRGKSAETYEPIISIANTSKQLMNWLHKRLGGSLIDYKMSRWQDRHKDSQLLQFQAFHHIKAILKEVIPFLVLKKKEANLLWEYCEIATSHIMSIKERRQYYLGMRNLKKRRS